MTVTAERVDSTFVALREQIEAESVEETLQRVAEIEARRRADAAEEAVALAKLDAAKAYQRDGHASMHGVLRSRLGWSEGEFEAVGTDSDLRRTSPLYRRLHEIHFQRASA